jgi:hypothetical protein
MSAQTLGIAVLLLVLPSLANAQMGTDKTNNSTATGVTKTQATHLPKIAEQHVTFREQRVVVSETGEETLEVIDKTVSGYNLGAMIKNGEDTSNMASASSPYDSMMVKIISNKQSNTETAHIMATGVVVEDTTSPNGVTRIIRVSPQNGGRDTLITITK